MFLGIRENIFALITEENEVIRESLAKHEDLVINADSLIAIISEIVEIRSEEAAAYHFLYKHVQNTLYQGLLSILRRHETQSQLMLRHSIETSCLAAYSLHETNMTKFIVSDKFGAKPVIDIKDSAYRWLKANYPEQSNRLKFIKDRINEFYAHGNMFTTFKTLTSNNGEKKIGFLDKQDLLIEKTHIWEIGHVASVIFILIHEVSKNSSIVLTCKETFQRFIPLLKVNQVYREKFIKEKRLAKWGEV